MKAAARRSLTHGATWRCQRLLMEPPNWLMEASAPVVLSNLQGRKRKVKTDTHI